MTKTVTKAATKRVATAPHLQIAHRIEALLRTMRVIERHEEQLCIVMTDIRSAKTVTPEAHKELKALLEELPSEAYQADLDAVARALTAIHIETESSAKRSSGVGKRKKAKPGALK